MGTPAATVAVDARFTDAQMALLRQGLVPDEQEDKWFVVFDEGAQVLRAYRSWTGFLAFEARFEKAGDGWKVASATVNRDPDQVNSGGDASDAAMVASTLRMVIDHR
jgi:hypothetical protein